MTKIKNMDEEIEKMFDVPDEMKISLKIARSESFCKILLFLESQFVKYGEISVMFNTLLRKTDIPDSTASRLLRDMETMNLIEKINSKTTLIFPKKDKNGNNPLTKWKNLAYQRYTGTRGTVEELIKGMKKPEESA